MHEEEACGDATHQNKKRLQTILPSYNCLLDKGLQKAGSESAREKQFIIQQIILYIYNLY